MRIDHRRLVTSSTRLARLAGVLYLLVVALVGVARVGVHAGLRVPGIAPRTTDLTAVPAPVSHVVDLALAAMVALVGVTAYLLLRRIDRRPRGTLTVFAVVAVGMVLINLAIHHAPQLVTGERTSEGLVVLLLDLHDHGYSFTGVCFGLWLLALGHLAYRSSVFPRTLSTLLIVSMVVAWLVGFLWSGLPAVVHAVLAPPPVADLWLVAYLVTKGVPTRTPEQLAPAAVST